MRSRLLIHLLPYLLLLGLGSCGTRHAVSRVEREADGETSGAPGIEMERGGPGAMGMAG